MNKQPKLFEKKKNNNKNNNNNNNNRDFIKKMMIWNKENLNKTTNKT